MPGRDRLLSSGKVSDMMPYGQKPGGRQGVNFSESWEKTVLAQESSSTKTTRVGCTWPVQETSRKSV